MSQPPPISNGRPPVWEVVIADMRARDQLGRQRYGTPLQPHNGRDALRDAYEEALDLAVYLRQALIERDAYEQVIVERDQPQTPPASPDVDAGMASDEVPAPHIARWLGGRR